MRSPDGERGLILVLAGGITLHHWQKLLSWLPLAPASLQEGPLLPRLSFAVLALAPPRAGRVVAEPTLVVQRSSLLWALLLARHLPMGMLEAGTVMPVGWPRWSADPHVLAFCQTLVIAIVTRSPWVGLAPWS